MAVFLHGCTPAVGASLPASPLQGLEEMGAHTVWGFPVKENWEGLGKLPALIPGVFMGPAHWNSYKRKSWVPAPFLHGLCQDGAQERSPVRAQHGTVPLARPPAVVELRLSS